MFEVQKRKKKQTANSKNKIDLLPTLSFIFIGFNFFKKIIIEKAAVAATILYMNTSNNCWYLLTIASMFNSFNTKHLVLFIYLFTNESDVCTCVFWSTLGTRHNWRCYSWNCCDDCYSNLVIALINIFLIREEERRIIEIE